MKKIVLFLLSVAAAVLSVPVMCSAQGETGAVSAGWTIDCGGELDLTQCSCILTSEESYDGGHSIKLSRTQPDNGSLYNLRNRSIDGLATGSYEIGMYLKGNEDDINKLYIELDGPCAGLDTMWFSNKTKLENGWWYFTHTITANAPVTNIYFKQFNALSAPVYIDCVSLTKSGGTVNYLVNGDFEWDFEKNDAGTVPAGWFQNASNTENVYGYYTVTNEDSFVGKAALKLMNADFTNNDDKQVYLRNSSVYGNPAGNYVLTMYVKTDQTIYMTLNLDGASGSHNLQYPGDYTSEDAGNGWRKITAVYNAQDTVTQFNMCLFGCAGGILIDNISLCKEGSSENLLLGGSFEADSSDESYIDKYYPTNVQMPVSSGAAAVSWTNPAAASLTGMRVYNLTNGKTQVPVSVSVVSGAQNSIDITSYEGIQLFKLEFDFSDRASTFYLISGNTNRADVAEGAATGSGGDLSVSAKAMENALEISWLKNSKSKGCKSVYLYKTENGKQIRFAQLYANAYSAIIPDLTNGVEYEYTVKAGYGDGLESNGVTVKGVPSANQAEKGHGSVWFKNLTFTNRGYSLLGSNMNVQSSYITNITEGYISASLYVKNTGTTARDVCKIMALYNNDILVDMVFLNKTVEPTPDNMPGEKFTTIMYVPASDADNHYRISELVWDRMNTASPILEVSRLN